LGDVPGEMDITGDPANGDRIHEIEVATDEFAEGGLGAEFGVVAQELVGGFHDSSPV